jgi:hypothetical protein
VPAPKVQRIAVKKKIFCASRLVPAPKVHKKSVKKKFFFALRAMCLRLRFTWKAGKIFFRASRLVPAPKVHKKSAKTEKFPRLAPCAGVYGRENGFSRFLFAFKVQTKAMRVEICALHKKSRENKICASRFVTGYRENRLPSGTLASRPNVSGQLKSREHSFA